ncbi:type III pantothenate kinase [Algimonas ampicilliniresistens]|jgi:type III pantothenate kinase|uniref:Type III pantothenate kinase n=1 Tax=Algimonas ampicilliniresistens TaxID=1298735 RepID=A0ABQ5V7D9_9PROT|nr:type III pantothenate kinase [Algimonas ampicilliniresistens]GLQ23441.1 type III pantothenate kinase [Algimonas ampicilliniresistens]
MLLVIDSGNTNTLFAIHNKDGWAGQWRIATDSARTADEYAVWFYQLMHMAGLRFEDISDCVISTVVPQSLFNLRNLARRHMSVEPLIVGEPDVDLGVKVRLDNPGQVGADRLVNALGAAVVFDGPLILIDSGTATTFDIVSADRHFEGGIIAPGINLSMRALHEAAAQLPRIAIKRPETVVGTDTVSAMQSGVFWGYIGLIDGIVERIREEDGRDFTVVGTGGVASLFEGASETIQHYDADLTIRGLLEIWKLNGPNGQT